MLYLEISQEEAQCLSELSNIPGVLSLRVSRASGKKTLEASRDHSPGLAPYLTGIWKKPSTRFDNVDNATRGLVDLCDWPSYCNLAATGGSVTLLLGRVGSSDYDLPVIKLGYEYPSFAQMFLKFIRSYELVH